VDFGLGRIRNILLVSDRVKSASIPDRDLHPGHGNPDPDRFQYQAHVFSFFSQKNVNMLSKILKIMILLPGGEKGKTV
jgi:hypothetical protein